MHQTLRTFNAATFALKHSEAPPMPNTQELRADQLDEVVFSQPAFQPAAVPTAGRPMAASKKRTGDAPAPSPQKKPM
jgi:hypothetical protein